MATPPRLTFRELRAWQRHCLERRKSLALPVRQNGRIETLSGVNP